MNNYEEINLRIKTIKDNFPYLRDKKDDFVFSAVCIKNIFYKNPNFECNEETFKRAIVDGKNDGGVDFLLKDPNSDEASNIILGQSKLYTTISLDDIRNAISKLYYFYIKMKDGDYQNLNDSVKSEYISLMDDFGDESKIIFVVCTSAPKNSINRKSINKFFKDLTKSSENIELQIYFDNEIYEAILETESRRPSIESGSINIDEPDNCLYYGDDALITNVSGFSIKELYSRYGNNLLARNLRYYVKKRDIDDDIKRTIKENPESFRFKNNGITIICDDFDVSSKVIHLKNFSIINGGQTTYILSKSEINKENDIFLTCKIIKAIGENNDEKNKFILDISKATNSQKPIKQVDLKSNMPEQVRFSQTMRNLNIFYQTKRGETIPKQFKFDYLNTDLAEIGKLALAGLWQLPGASRNKPSSLYLDKFYNPVFSGDQNKIARLSKDFLYINYFFNKKFLNKYSKETQDDGKRMFAGVCRTSCIAFCGLISRLHCKNLDLSDYIKRLSNFGKENFYDDYLYDVLKDFDKINVVFNEKMYQNLDNLDSDLYDIFKLFIESYFSSYGFSQETSNGLDPSNYLKKDSSYFKFLRYNLESLLNEINKNYSSVF